MPENETVHTIRVEGAEDAIKKFRALADAKQAALDVSGSGGSSVAETRGGGYWNFGDAPPAPGTTGSPQTNGGIPTPGAVPVPGAAGGVNAGAITIHANHVTIYATGLSVGGSAGMTSVHSPSGNGYTTPPGGAPPAPGTGGTPSGSPSAGGGLFQRLNSFLDRSLNPTAPYSASVRDLLTAGAETGSVSGFASTLLNFGAEKLMGGGLAGAGIGLALNTALQVGSAMYSASMPSYNFETQMRVAAAGGQYVTEMQRRGGAEAAKFEGDTQFARSMVGMFSGIPILGQATSLFYEYNFGRERDRTLAEYRASIEQAQRSLIATQLTGSVLNFGSDPLGSAKLGLIQSGTMFGQGGAQFGLSMSGLLPGMLAANGDNLPAATNYANALMGFAGRSQWGFLGAMVQGGLARDPNSANRLQAAYLQSAAETGDFGALSVAYNANPRLPLGGYFGLAAQVAGINTDTQIASSGLSYAQAQAGLVGATGGSAEQRATAMDASDVYFGRMLGYTDELLAISKDPLRVAQLTAQRKQLEAQRASNITAALSVRYQGEISVVQTGLGGASFSAQEAMFGTNEAAVVSAYEDVAGFNLDLAGIYGRMARESRFSPEQRQQYALMARQAQFQGTTGARRQIGGFYLGLEQGRLGIESAQVQAGASGAQLFGGINAISASGLAQAGVFGEEATLVRQQLAGAYGPTTMQERLELQARLTSLVQQEIVAREGAVRGLSQMQVALAQTAQGMAQSQQQRAYITGAGGVEGYGYAARTSQAAQGVVRASEARVAMLRARGVADDNPEMQQATMALENARTAYEQSEVSATQVPFTLELRREESRNEFAIRALSVMPGQYGSMRTLLGKQMEEGEHKAKQIIARREAHRAKFGGHLPEHLEFEYEQQLQSVALEQAGTFQQLSYGWESRLTSQMLGSTGSMAFISPSMSFAAAIGSGVVNPHMGATQEQVPFFLRQAQLISSLAGTGSREGQMLAGVTGANLDGLEITLRVPLPGGGMESVPAQLTVKGNNQDTSPAAHLEMVGRAGAHVAHQ